MKLKIGETVEHAMWITGEESPDIILFHKTNILDALNELCQWQGFTHGPVRFLVKKPGDDRVPQVPDHIQGQAVRLLIAEADITGRVVQVNPPSFIAQLELTDLNRLRAITRGAARRELSDTECDSIIEELGPNAAIEVLRKQPAQPMVNGHG